MNTPLPNPARYCPYSQLGEQPNIIVDGSAQKATVLTLSHWPWSPTADELLRDTSTDIVFAYLDSPAHHQDIDLVSNSHFDEDGLLSMYALIDPENALKYRQLMIGASRAGDFEQPSRKVPTSWPVTPSNLSTPTCAHSAPPHFAAPGARKSGNTLYLKS